MTVCIAARAKMIPKAGDTVGQPVDVIVAAADRMLTAGDVQFEPSAGTKIFTLSSSIFMMTAGDAALQAEITGWFLEKLQRGFNGNQIIGGT
jgi:hypothetical protein